MSEGIKKLAITLMMLGMPMVAHAQAGVDDGEMSSYAMELIEQLTMDDDRAQEAYGKLMVMRDLDAVAVVRAHLDDQRKTSFGFEIVGAVACLEDPCPPPDLRVGDVCSLVLGFWLEGEIPRCCRYFQYNADKEEMLNFLDSYHFTSFSQMQLMAAEYALGKSQEKGLGYEDVIAEAIEKLR